MRLGVGTPRLAVPGRGAGADPFRASQFCPIHPTRPVASHVPILSIGITVERKVSSFYGHNERAGPKSKGKPVEVPFLLHEHELRHRRKEGPRFRASPGRRGNMSKESVKIRAHLVLNYFDRSAYRARERGDRGT